ncbi:LasU family protein [Lactiplantibacillus daowaiensis]|uniref:LasU family protein n=1 Tax=Lactiplantibacillus daowaiensis TaxID=2559918 RepID=A0ABW1S481_9LACO|nr:LasU family protein [Lactiplantibacillus daowaiensis]
MRKLITLAPTWLLLGLLVTGFFISTSQPIIGHNYLAFSTLGLELYPVIVLFIAGIAKAASGVKTYSLREKWFYGYLLGLEIVVVLGAIFWMAHN